MFREGLHLGIFFPPSFMHFINCLSMHYFYNREMEINFNKGGGKPYRYSFIMLKYPWPAQSWTRFRHHPLLSTSSRPILMNVFLHCNTFRLLTVRKTLLTRWRFRDNYSASRNLGTKREKQLPSVVLKEGEGEIGYQSFCLFLCPGGGGLGWGWSGCSQCNTFNHPEQLLCCLRSTFRIFRV